MSAVLSLIPDHLQKEHTGHKLSSAEIDFINAVAGRHPYLLKHLTRTVNPYEGTAWQVDFVLPLIGHPLYRGLCIEIHGGVRQGSNSKTGKRSARTGHTSWVGYTRDRDKSLFAQNSMYQSVEVVTGEPSLKGAVEYIHSVFMVTKKFRDELTPNGLQIIEAVKAKGAAVNLESRAFCKVNT